MACGGCKGSGNRHAGDGGDLRKFAFLSSHQIRHLKALEDANKEAEESTEEEQK